MQGVLARWIHRRLDNPSTLRSWCHRVWRVVFRVCLPSRYSILYLTRAGLQGNANSTVYSWLSTNFTVPNDWDGDSVLLNFGAVDNEATVFVNGQEAAFHRGGYFEFTVDVTEYINFDAANEL